MHTLLCLPGHNLRINKSSYRPLSVGDQNGKSSNTTLFGHLVRIVKLSCFILVWVFFPVERVGVMTIVMEDLACYCK